MDYEKFLAEFTMTNEEMTDVINNHLENVDMNNVNEMILSIIERQTEKDKQVMNEAKQIIKITYIAREMYRFGFMYALYMYNNTIKEKINDMQASDKYILPELFLVLRCLRAQELSRYIYKIFTFGLV